MDQLKKSRPKQRFPDIPETGDETAKPALRFVVQKHNTSCLHYDFQLEIGRVLKSRAVPKGPPFVPGEKHLTFETAQHSLENADFWERREELEQSSKHLQKHSVSLLE